MNRNPNQQELANSRYYYALNPTADQLNSVLTDLVNIAMDPENVDKAVIAVDNGHALPPIDEGEDGENILNFVAGEAGGGDTPPIKLDEWELPVGDGEDWVRSSELYAINSKTDFDPTDHFILIKKTLDIRDDVSADQYNEYSLTISMKIENANSTFDFETYFTNQNYQHVVDIICFPESYYARVKMLNANGEQISDIGSAESLLIEGISGGTSYYRFYRNGTIKIYEPKEEIKLDLNCLPEDYFIINFLYLRYKQNCYLLKKNDDSYASADMSNQSYSQFIQDTDSERHLIFDYQDYNNNIYSIGPTERLMDNVIFIGTDPFHTEKAFDHLGLHNPMPGMGLTLKDESVVMFEHNCHIYNDSASSKIAKCEIFIEQGNPSSWVDNYENTKPLGNEKHKGPLIDIKNQSYVTLSDYAMINMHNSAELTMDCLAIVEIHDKAGVFLEGGPRVFMHGTYNRGTKSSFQQGEMSRRQPLVTIEDGTILNINGKDNVDATLTLSGGSSIIFNGEQTKLNNDKDGDIYPNYAPLFLVNPDSFYIYGKGKYQTHDTIDNNLYSKNQREVTSDIDGTVYSINNDLLRDRPGPFMAPYSKLKREQQALGYITQTTYSAIFPRGVQNDGNLKDYANNITTSSIDGTTVYIMDSTFINAINNYYYTSLHNYGLDAELFYASSGTQFIGGNGSFVKMIIGGESGEYTRLNVIGEAHLECKESIICVKNMEDQDPWVLLEPVLKNKNSYSSELIVNDGSVFRMRGVWDLTNIPNNNWFTTQGEEHPTKKNNATLFEMTDNAEFRMWNNATFKIDNTGITMSDGTTSIHFTVAELAAALAGGGGQSLPSAESTQF